MGGCLSALRTKNFRHAGVRYLVFGVAGIVVSVLITAYLHEIAGLPPDWSFAIAMALMCSFHFSTNALFVFRSGAHSTVFRRYVATSLAFRTAEFVVARELMNLESMPYPTAILIAALLSNCGKFLVYSKYVFVPTRRSAQG